MKRTRIFGRFLAAAAAILAVFILNACQPDAVGSYQSPLTPTETIFSRATKRSLAYEGIRRNPVILIHGLLGAKLADQATGDEFWGTFSPTLPGRDSLKLLSVPMSWGKPLRELSNNTRASFLLDTVSIRVMGVEFSMYAYGPLVDTIREAGYVQEGSKEHLEDGRCPTFFIFYYDWRRSIAENAAELGKFIRAKQAQLDGEYRIRYGTAPETIRADGGEAYGFASAVIGDQYGTYWSDDSLVSVGSSDPDDRAETSGQDPASGLYRWRLSSGSGEDHDAAFQLRVKSLNTVKGTVSKSVPTRFLFRRNLRICSENTTAEMSGYEGDAVTLPEPGEKTGYSLGEWENLGSGTLTSTENGQTVYTFGDGDGELRARYDACTSAIFAASEPANSAANAA